MTPSRDISRLIEIMAALRTPVTGCPWDLEQDFATIAPYTIEEAYEVADAAFAGDAPNSASTVRSFSRITCRFPQSGRAEAENACNIFALSACCAPANTGSAHAATTRRASTFFITFSLREKVSQSDGQVYWNWRRLESEGRAGAAGALLHHAAFRRCLRRCARSVPS